MTLNWGGLWNVGGDIPEDDRLQITEALNRVAERVAGRLREMGLARTASPLFRAWHLLVVRDDARVYAAFSTHPGGSGGDQYWGEAIRPIPSAAAVVQTVAQQYGRGVDAIIVLPRGLDDEKAIQGAADAHAADVERAFALARLGDIRDFAHLEPYLRRFLEDHPEPSRNVFILMRFLETDEFKTIHRVIQEALAERGYEGLRADDRDYTGDLWTNLEVHMVGCQLGIAVFEDIEERAFNPNVALELGWMLGRRRRCLILKEKRLPTLPTDVIGKLYKPFDQFSIDDTVRTQVLRWLDVDIGAPAGA